MGYVRKIRSQTMAAQDKRMSVVNELVSAVSVTYTPTDALSYRTVQVKFIKYFAWESKWIDRALAAREVELGLILRGACVDYDWSTYIANMYPRSSNRESCVPRMLHFGTHLGFHHRFHHIRSSRERAHDSCGFHIPDPLYHDSVSPPTSNKVCYNSQERTVNLFRCFHTTLWE